MGGGCFPRLPQNAGIRQGCPLSPVLFITVLEPFFRRLKRALPEACIKAYADDVALVAAFGPPQIQALARECNDFGAVSGLTLDIPKSVLHPLRPELVANATAAVRRAGVGWEGPEVAHKTTYLGL